VGGFAQSRIYHYVRGAGRPPCATRLGFAQSVRSKRGVLLARAVCVEQEMRQVKGRLGGRHFYIVLIYIAFYIYYISPPCVSSRRCGK
jgi:hypothetical protein